MDSRRETILAFLKTHGQTTDKANDVRKISSFLGLPLGAVIVAEVDKDDVLNQLVA